MAAGAGLFGLQRLAAIAAAPEIRLAPPGIDHRHSDDSADRVKHQQEESQDFQRDPGGRVLAAPVFCRHHLQPAGKSDFFSAARAIDLQSHVHLLIGDGVSTMTASAAI